MSDLALTLARCALLAGPSLPVLSLVLFAGV